MKMVFRSLNLVILVYVLFKEKNNFTYPLLQSDPDPVKKVPDPAGQKSLDPDPHNCFFFHFIAKQYG